MSRLLAYEEANESINDLDFLLAITRLVFISDNSIITKAYKLKGLTKNLILYLITDNQEIRIKKSAFLDSTAQTVVRYFFGNETQLTKEEKQTLFWAIAARTKKPDGIFDEFNKTVFKHYPNIVKPYEVNWEIKELEEKQRWNNKVLIENKIILNYYTSYFQNRKLLYSESYYSKKNNHGYMPADTNFIYSFVPNFAEPFFFRMLNVYSIKSDLTSDSQKKAFNESLKTLLIYRPNIDKSANLFLATGFLSNASINRDLSVEIFIQGVTEKRLNVALLGHNIGKLLAGNYAPLQRLSDSLLALKNISALNDAALIIFFENMLIEFTGETPKGFVKLLEFYNELLLNYEKKPSTLLDKNIYKWQENLSLKKQMLKLKGLIK